MIPDSNGAARDYITDTLPELLQLLQGSDVRELDVREGEVHVRLHRAPPVEGDEIVVEVAESDVTVPQIPSLAEVTAPLVGTYYRAEQPGSPPLVDQGSQVEDHTPVGIIEALGELIEVEAGCTGTVVDVLVTDGQPVQYGQLLLTVAPSG